MVAQSFQGATLGKMYGNNVCALLDEKEYIALIVDCTICGFFRYFRSNKLEGGRTIARTNLTKNEFL